MIDSNWKARCKQASTEEEKLDVVVEYLTENHLGLHGGYPYDCLWIDNYLVIAGLQDEDGYQTSLRVYAKIELLGAFNEAIKNHAEYEDDSFEEYLAEAIFSLSTKALPNWVCPKCEQMGGLEINDGSYPGMLVVECQHCQHIDVRSEA